MLLFSVLCRMVSKGSQSVIQEGLKLYFEADDILHSHFRWAVCKLFEMVRRDQPQGIWSHRWCHQPCCHFIAISELQHAQLRCQLVPGCFTNSRARQSDQSDRLRGTPRLRQRQSLWICAQDQPQISSLLAQYWLQLSERSNLRGTYS